MKLLLLGASGRTGQYIINEAIELKYEVNCLVRDPDKVRSHPLINIVPGDVSEPGQLKPLLKDCDAVLSVLNVSRKSDFPWSGLRTPADFMSSVTNGLLPLMEEVGVKRIIVCSAWGVGDSRPQIPGWFRWFIDHSNIGSAYADHERQEEILQDSGLNWTIVRPVGLTNNNKPEDVLESYHNESKPTLTISRKSVARYMLSAINNESLIRKTVAISKAR